jgi:hypothetical protein
MSIRTAEIRRYAVSVMFKRMSAIIETGGAQFSQFFMLG